MTKEKFNTWLKLWRIGLAPDPEVLALIIDVPNRHVDFYDRITSQFERLSEMGLTLSSRRNQDSNIMDYTRCWIGPSDVVREFEALVKLEIDRVKKQGDALSNEAAQYMGLRYWIIEDGTLAAKEWRETWQRSESAVD